MERLEGRHSVMAALLARQRRFEVILVSHQAHTEKVQPLLDLAAQLGVAVRRVDGRELNQQAHAASHGGVVAICSPKPRLNGDDLPQLLKSVSNPLVLLLEGIVDARNLGFTLRSAEALGACAVLVKKHLWDFDSTEVARPASGAYERLPLVQIDTVEPLGTLRRGGLRLLGCVAGARRTIYDDDLTGPLIVAIGGEKRGLSGAVREICDGLISIPCPTPAASLALSHAAAIILAESMRQRSAAKQT